MFEHFFRVGIGDEETDVESLDGFSSKDDKGLGSAHQEPHELFDEDTLNLVRLFDAKTHTDRVDGRLDQTLLIFIPAHDERIQKGFIAQPSLDFGVVVSLDDLRGKVLKTQRGSQRAPHCTQIIFERIRHASQTVPAPSFLDFCDTAATALPCRESA